MATFGQYLASWSDDALISLLTARPDLADPAPVTVRALVTHATAHASISHALMHLDAAALQVLESAVVLDGASHHAVLRAVAGDRATPEERAVVEERITAAMEQALVWNDGGTLRATPGLAQVLGPYPAGLGPQITDAPTSLAAIAEGPPHARRLLEALTWGPPVGVVDAASPRGEVTTWLVAHHFLQQVDSHHVVLPRSVGIALRGGRTHAAVALPPQLRTTPANASAAEAEAASAGLELVRRATELLRSWQESPPRMLRSGGLPVRELRRAAEALDADDMTAAMVIELAGTAGLIREDDEEPTRYIPTDLADWESLTHEQQWALLARAWLHSPRTPWAVGRRDQRGVARAALASGLERPWVPTLRHRILSLLATHRGSSVDTPSLCEYLAWSTPRAVPPASAITELLDEARGVGALVLGTLTSIGAAVLQHPSPPARPNATDPVLEAFRTALPPAVDEILLQGDLTGIVPGRPTPNLEELVELASEIESRGAGLTVRFTSASITRALDTGRSGTEVREALASHSPTPLPQPLEYLISDAARHHGNVRIGTAQSYIRLADPAQAAALVTDPKLASAQLFLLAPTVLAAQIPAGALLDLVRNTGVSPVLERPDGTLLPPGAVAAHRGAPPERAQRHTESPAPGRDRAQPGTDDSRNAAAQAVGRLRQHQQTTGTGAGTRREAASSAFPWEAQEAPLTSHATEDPGRSDPVGALGTLREAAAAGTQVRIGLVGARGRTETRVVVPVSVAGGRLRLRDVNHGSDLVVAVHRLLDAEHIAAPAADGPTTA